MFDLHAQQQPALRYADFFHLPFYVARADQLVLKRTAMGRL
jgi:hypothetical protein